MRMSVKVRKNCQKFDLYNLSKQYKCSTSAMDQNTPDRQDSRNRLASSQRFLDALASLDLKLSVSDSPFFKFSVIPVVPVVPVIPVIPVVPVIPVSQVIPVFQ